MKFFLIAKFVSIAAFPSVTHYYKAMFRGMKPISYRHYVRVSTSHMIMCVVKLYINMLSDGFKVFV